MVSTLIIGGTTEKRAESARDLCMKEAVDLLDQHWIERVDDVEKGTKQSIGIESIKLLQKKLYLTPVKSKMKAIIVREGELLTTEAQNALLKVLEEPPIQSIFILTAPLAEDFLPTIRSRCKVIAVSSEQKEFTDAERKQLVDLLTKLQNHTIRGPLSLAEPVTKNRKDSIAFLENILRIAHKEIPSITSRHDMRTFSELLHDLWHVYKTIKSTNASQRLLLESFFLTYTKE